MLQFSMKFSSEDNKKMGKTEQNHNDFPSQECCFVVHSVFEIKINDNHLAAWKCVISVIIR